MTEVMRIDLATLRNEHREAVAQREMAWNTFVSAAVFKISKSLNEQFIANCGKGDRLVATVHLDDITGADTSKPFVTRFQGLFHANPREYLDGHMGDAGYSVQRLGGNMSRTYSVEILMDHKDTDTHRI